MTYSKLTFPATGGQQTYNVTFPALAKDHIRASVDGTEVTTFTITGAYKTGGGTITFSAPVFAGGEVISIWRVTGTIPLVDYQGGASIREADLDLDAAQALYLIEEQIQVNADTYQTLAEKGEPDGYAGLGSTGKVPVEQLGGAGGSTSTYLRGDGTWQPVTGGGGGGGDVYSPGLGSVSVDELAAFNNVDGTLLKGSGIPLSTVLVDADIGTTIPNLTGGLVPTSELGTGTADDTTFLRGDGTWQVVSATGGVTGPGSSTDGEIPLFSGTGGSTLKNSSTLLSALLTTSLKGAAGGLAELDGSGLVPKDQLADAGVPSASTFLNGAGQWAVPGGTGNVSGPGVSTERAIAVYADTSGTALANSPVTVTTGGNIENVSLVDGRDVSLIGTQVDGLLAGASLWPSSDEKDALVGTFGTPSSTNPYVTTQDPRVAVFKGDDDGVSGNESTGLVPAPNQGDWTVDKKFLSARGSWETPALADLAGIVLIDNGGTAATSASEAANNLLPRVDNLGTVTNAALTHRGNILIRNANELVEGGAAPAWVQMDRGPDGSYLKSDDSNFSTGLTWDIPPAAGNVFISGPTHGDLNVPIFSGTDTGIIIDSGFAFSDLPSNVSPAELGRVVGGAWINRQHKMLDCAGFTQRVQADSWAGGGIVEVAGEGEYLKFSTANTIYSESPSAPQPQGACGPLWLHQELFKPKLHLPWAFRFVFTAPNTTDAQLYVGLFNYNPTLNISTTAGRQHIVFYTAGSGSSAVRSYSGGGIEDVTVGPAISPGQRVVLDYIAEDLGGGDYQVYVKVNGALIVTLTSANNLPGYTAGLSLPYALTPALRMRNTTANSRWFHMQSLKFYYTAAL